MRVVLHGGPFHGDEVILPWDMKEYRIPYMDHDDVMKLVHEVEPSPEGPLYQTHLYVDAGYWTSATTTDPAMRIFEYEETTEQKRKRINGAINRTKDDAKMFVNGKLTMAQFLERVKREYSNAQENSNT